MTYAGVMTYNPPIERFWECPLQCGTRKRTVKGGTITVTHQCPERGGLDVPLQAAGRHGLIGRPHHVVHVPRGDYTNGDLIHPSGRMAVHAYRPDGSHDTVVFAPTARASGLGEDPNA